ncbi:MAG TPA: hypothetical protein ENJ28_12040 [Gammaproteobacteria bacterium]|nr:hypothetical protein [Gammaproteobacteria bacterium]
MRRKVNRFPDDVALKIATEYLTTSASIRELQEKYGFTGAGTLYNWIRKFGLSKPDKETLKIHQIMEKEKEKNKRSKEDIEKENKELKRQLEFERLKSKAYEKMIEIAERELSISIKKNFGYKR